MKKDERLLAPSGALYVPCSAYAIFMAMMMNDNDDGDET